MTADRPEDRVAMPEEEDLAADFSAQERRKGLSPAIKLGGLIAGGAGLLGLAMFMMSSEQVADSQLRRPPTLDATPGGEVMAESPEFRERLREMNERRADMASERGITSMPTPEIILRPNPPVIERVEDIPEVERRTVTPAPAAPRVDRRVLPAPPAAARPVETVGPEPREPQSRPAAQRAQEDEENPFVDAMTAYMGNIARRQEPMNMSSGALPRPGWLDAEDTGLAAAAGNGDETREAAAPRAMILRPGDILHAEMVNSVNSDMASPVMAEITTGPHRGARLLGTFQADPTAARMVVNFTSMTLEDGTVVQINAFAVDGRSAESAVASDVNRRYIARYAPILASTFISTYAQVRAQPERRVIGTGQDIEVAVGRSTGTQAGFAGLGAAADAVSRDIAASAPRGPLIHLRSGFPLAILFVDPVEVPVRD